LEFTLNLQVTRPQRKRIRMNVRYRYDSPLVGKRRCNRSPEQ